MKRIHLIVDISYLYHRHVYSVRSGKRKKLSAIVDGQLVDTTMIYYTLMDFEAIRRRWLTACDELVVSLCFDSKSERKAESDDYKSNRNALDENDFDSIREIQGIVTRAEYNIYKADGKEADDLITSLVKNFKDDFDFTVIYTPDSDLLVNIDTKVGVMRYKSSLAKDTRGKDVMDKAHMAIGIGNFSQVMGLEWECIVPLNVTLLYKCTCGDKSDKVKGIRGFGPAAFNSYINYLNCELGVTDEQYSQMANADVVEDIIKKSADYFGELKTQQALESLELVKFRPVGVCMPTKRDTDSSREREYSRYAMVSLLK